MAARLGDVTLSPRQRACMDLQGLVDLVVRSESPTRHVLRAQHGNYWVAEFMHRSDADLVAGLLNERAAVMLGGQGPHSVSEALP